MQSFLDFLLADCQRNFTIYPIVRVLQMFSCEQSSCERRAWTFTGERLQPAAPERLRNLRAYLTHDSKPANASFLHLQEMQTTPCTAYLPFLY